jgi:hypothetical protein
LHLLHSKGILKIVEKLETTVPEAISATNSYSGKTLLLVEDEVLIAMNEAEMLESNGFRVISASKMHTGKE